MKDNVLYTDNGKMEMIEAQITYDASKSSVGNDLLWSVRAIAAEIGRTERQTYHMLTLGQLPAERVGGRWCASRSGLRRRFAKVLGGPAA
jgi:hypothetical protein